MKFLLPAGFLALSIVASQYGILLQASLFLTGFGLLINVDFSK